MSYTIGNVVRITVQFRDESGTLVDPTDVAFRVASLSGQKLSPSTSRKSAGIYVADVTASEPGTWHYRATASGAVVAATEGEFHVAGPRAAFET